MSDNARFHNKLHRKNHHTTPTDGYPDSATDPIASESEPFTGDFFLNGNLNVFGAINTVYNTLSNISIPVPVLSAQIGFQPSNSLVVQLSGVKYAIPVTLVGNNTFNNGTSGINSLANYVTYIGNVSSSGTLSGKDSNNWNLIYSTVIANSGSWNGGNNVYTAVGANSGNWDSAYTTVNTNSGNWNSNVAVSNYVITNSATFDNSYTSSVYAKLSSLAYTFNYSNNSIQANSLNNCTPGQLAGVLAGLYNNACGYAAVVAGGGTNTASGNYSIIGGGGGNVVSGNNSGILGGLNNSVSGCNSFAIGSGIIATTPDYTFVNNLSSLGTVNALSGYMRIISVGREGIGDQLSNTVGQFFSNEGTFSQINHQNVCNGANASTDYIATADNGNDSCYYADLGINSSFYSNSAYDITGPNDAYLFTHGCNLAVGTTGDTGDVIIHTGGSRAQNERMRVTSLGNVGIGTSTPGSTLTVIGNISATGTVCYSNPIYCVGAAPNSIVPANGSNTSSGYYSVVLGGSQNIATGANSVIGGGFINCAIADYSVVGGGRLNNSLGNNTFVGGGDSNTTASSYSSILGGRCNEITSNSGYSVIGGGQNNTVTGIGSVINGGTSNTVSSNYGIIVGGNSNSICTGASGSFIAGGCNNQVCATANNSFILGSNLQAIEPNYTYVNNIVSQGNVCGNSIIGNAVYGTTLNGGTVSGTNFITFNEYNYGNSLVAGDLTVIGTINATAYTGLSSNRFKYSTIIGDGILSSFTVNHNLSTEDVFVTVVDYTTKEVVYPSIRIPNQTQIDVGFSFIPPASSYKVLILTSL